MSTENLNSDSFVHGLEEASDPSELLGISYDTLTHFYTTLTTLFQQQEYVKVRDGFHFMTFLCPKTAEYWSALGLTETQLQKYDKAEEAYLEALELDPSSQEIYLGCLNVYIQQQEFSQAEALCDKGILYAQDNNNVELEQTLRAAKQELKCTEKEEL
jgi:tetratricopeptide (TPR) repeat protein